VERSGEQDATGTAASELLQVGTIAHAPGSEHLAADNAPAHHRNPAKIRALV
jgi:hypothetical protein